MPTNRKISQLTTDAAPARTDYLTSLEGQTVNVKALISAVLGLTTDADLDLSDITTNDVTIAAHGFAPKAPNDTGKFLRGDATWNFASPPYLQYRDEKAQNTSGGTFTSGAWQTRTLNTEVADTGGYGTLAANQITLTAGTYYIRASAPAWRVNRHQLRLQNVTDATTILVGQGAYTLDTGTGDGSESNAFLEGTFTIAASKALELQHRCQTTVATRGFGVEANFTTEVYVVVELWRIG